MCRWMAQIKGQSLFSNAHKNPEYKLHAFSDFVVVVVVEKMNFEVVANNNSHKFTQLLALVTDAISHHNKFTLIFRNILRNLYISMKFIV